MRSHAMGSAITKMKETNSTANGKSVTSIADAPEKTLRTTSMSRNSACQ